MFCLFLPDQPAPSRHQMVRRHTKPHLILSAAWGDALPGAPLPRVAPSTTVPIFKAQSEPNNTLNALCKSAYLIDFLHKKHLLQVIYEKKKKEEALLQKKLEGYTNAKYSQFETVDTRSRSRELARIWLPIIPRLVISLTLTLLMTTRPEIKQLPNKINY